MMNNTELLNDLRKMGGPGRCRYCGEWHNNVAYHESNRCVANNARFHQVSEDKHGNIKRQPGGRIMPKQTRKKKLPDHCVAVESVRLGMEGERRHD